MNIEIINEAKKYYEEMRRDYEYLHTCPGVGFDIKETFDYVFNILLELGYEPKKCGQSGIIADIGNGRGNSVLLRADMDGLPIKEESGVAFSSNNGNMHACGHDMHTSMLLGAARILKANENKINSRVRLMFQPAEEILQGAKDMIEGGALENPMIGKAVMLHVLSGMPFEVGTIIVSSPGVSAPCADYFSITVKGVGGHGAMPEKSVDPLVVGAHILLALQNINSRELSMGEKAVLTTCSISSNDTYNIIPEEVVIKGTMRCFDEDVRNKIRRRIEEISSNIAMAFNAKAKVSFDIGCPTLLNDEKLSCHIKKIMIELLGREKVYMSNELKGNKSGAGSEDFSYVSHEIPSVMIGICAGNANEGYTHGLHNSKVRFDEKTLINGAAVYAACGFELSK